MNEFASEISRHVWRSKYRYVDRTVSEHRISDSWRRIARTLAAVEPEENALWEDRFFSILQDFKFLPGGRIQAGAGTARKVTLFNCFVMGMVEDSIPGIFRALQEGAVTMQQGGGIGIDFSTLRPRGTQAKGAGSIASGPVSFMQVWDAMCGTILSTGARRGAMMATLRCDHPDIEEFLAAKQQVGHLRRFNLSVLVTDALMAAVRNDADWPLVFPAAAFEGDGQTVLREWSGSAGPISCRVVRHIRARHLWDLILHGAYDCAEPGVLFIDRINQLNNLRYREQISATAE
jgi:ribonucleoside-diphosphate reductase alpha chain